MHRHNNGVDQIVERSLYDSGFRHILLSSKKIIQITANKMRDNEE